MSSTRNYSKESRSYYSRSSSFSNSHANNSFRNRPLSSRLIEREPSLPSLIWNDLDDPYYFENRSRRFFDAFNEQLPWDFNDSFFDDKFFKPRIKKNAFNVERNIPIHYRNYNNSVTKTKTIPVQYSTCSNNHRTTAYKNIDQTTNGPSNAFQRRNEYFDRRENRNSLGDWPVMHVDNPTRKRTTLTVFVRPPRIQYSDVPQHERVMSTANYSSSNNRYHN